MHLWIVPINLGLILSCPHRRLYNRRIGEVLKELKLTEGRSQGVAVTARSGFSKILKAMKANSSPKLEFETDVDRSYFITRLPVHPQTIR